MAEVIVVGNLYDNGYNSNSSRVYDGGGYRTNFRSVPLSTDKIFNRYERINTPRGKGNMEEINTEFIGSIWGHGPSFAGAVFDVFHIAPTLTTMQGGGQRTTHIRSEGG